MIEDIARRISKAAITHSPTILTTIGVIGTISTAVLATRAAFRAARIIHEEKERHGELEPKYMVEVTYKEFVPPVVTGLVTISAIVGANRVGSRRTAAIAAAFATTDRAFSEYRSKILDRVGEKKERAYRDEIVQDQVARDEAITKEVIVLSGEVLCLDRYSGRYFSSDMETIKAAQNKVNYAVNNYFYASLTDFYNGLGIRPTSQSDDVGWNADKLLELEFSSAIADDGRPCLAFEFSVVPIRNYYRVN